ncbi:MAG: metallophosphoesterase [Coriobacteriales bacterium]
MLDRREFIKIGATGAMSLAAAASGMTWPLEAFAAAYGSSKDAWKFAVMADTQWKANLDGRNPGTCAVGIVNALNAQFIRHGAKFVIQVGDLVDKETDEVNGNPGVRTLSVRAAAAQALYDAGIGFYPLRGNHEGSVIAASEMSTLFPQMRGEGPNVFGATAFSSPFATLNGLSYAFDFGNVRFVMLDQFKRLDNTDYLGSSNNNIVDQIPWIEQQLEGRSPSTHAFVLAHKNLTGGNHRDCLFGGDPNDNLESRDRFINVLAENDVRYLLGGHDHMHHRSVIADSARSASVKQLICSSNSYKFYIPQRPSNDYQYNTVELERMMAEELWTIGYYIVTVDGPRLTIDYYAASTGVDFGDIDLTITPENLVFFKRESWGYSLNGKEFIVAPGDSYTVVEDRFQDSAARILDGSHGGTAVTDYAGRPMVKAVNTGWASPSGDERDAASAVLSIWGIADNLALWDDVLSGVLPDTDRTDVGDVYVLSMSYDTERAHAWGSGRYLLATRDEKGKWVNAVDTNHGGTARYIAGPWRKGYPLGSYGVDASSKTAWAVINHEGDFAVRRGIEAAAPGQRGRG